MKNLTTTIALSTLILLSQACGRRPDVAVAEKSMNAEDNNALAAAFFAPTGTASEEVRSMSLLVYPEPTDIAQFSFDPSAGSTSEEWKILLKEIPYSESLLASFSPSQDSFYKAKEIAKVILAAGQTRDKMFRDIDKAEKDEALEKERLTEREASVGITAASFASYVCYTPKSVTADGIFPCKLVKDTEYKIKKTARNCMQYDVFEFLDEVDETGKNLKVTCANLLTEVKRLKTKQQHSRRVRVAGENVVLDLLMEAEKANQRVFVATGTTTEKPDSAKPSSIVRFNREFTAIEEMRLSIEFLTDVASSKGSQVYSYAADGSGNGKITEPVFVFKKLRGLTYPQIKFTIMLPDMDIDVTADLSYEKGKVGLRLIDSKTYVRYHDGTKRRGVFKLEFEVI